jgi:hypothetical protein
MATVSEMRANVRAFADVDQTDVSDAEITRALNASYMELIGDASWSFLSARASLTTTSAQAEYDVVSIASDCEAHRIRRVQMLGRDLRYIAPEAYYGVNPFGASSNTAGDQPMCWAILESTTLAIWPAPPTGTARVIYVRKPPDLALDGDVPLTPSRYNDVLETGALARVFQKIGDLDTSELKKKEFSESVQGVHRDLLRTQETSPLFYGGDSQPPTLLPPLMDWSYVVAHP